MAGGNANTKRITGNITIGFGVGMNPIIRKKRTNNSRQILEILFFTL